MLFSQIVLILQCLILFIMNKKLIPISEGNELIKKIEGSDYIKNPLVYAQMRGNLSLLQTNVYVAIVAALQDRISQYYDKPTNGGQQLTLFDDELRDERPIHLSIPLSSLGIRSKYYKEIDEAVQKMQEVSYTIRHKVNGQWKIERHILLPIIKIPDTTSEAGYVRKKGMIEITMLAETAKHFFDMSTGYVSHLRNIVTLCKNSKTPRLYIYLCYLNSKQYNGVGEVNYMELKEFLGALEYEDKARTIIKTDKYKAFSYFVRDVLEPVKKELDYLADVEHQVEFSYEYTPNYPNGKTRGNPDSITFKLRKGKQIEELAEFIEDEATIKAREEEQKRHAEADKKALEEIRMAAEGDNAMRAKYGNSWEIVAKRYGYNIK